MKRSETFSAFAKAFAQFQAEVNNPKLTANNPHFKSKYSPLSEVLNTVRPILAKNGLSIHQDVSSEGDKVVVITTLYHESGEFLESSPLAISGSRGGKPADAQGLGSAASYAKRYQLQAVVGVAADEDTDGEELYERQQYQAPKPVQTTVQNKPVITKQTLAAKYQLVMGDSKGFEDYYTKQSGKGYDHTHISTLLDEAAKLRQTQPTT